MGGLKPPPAPPPAAQLRFMRFIKRPIFLLAETKPRQKSSLKAASLNGWKTPRSGWKALLETKVSGVQVRAGGALLGGEDQSGTYFKPGAQTQAAAAATAGSKPATLWFSSFCGKGENSEFCSPDNLTHTET